jgi:hypothetical protein
MPGVQQQFYLSRNNFIASGKALDYSAGVCWARLIG